MSEQRDRQLEEYLTGNSAVSRAYDGLGKESPPPALDNAILREARRELEADRRLQARWLRWTRWAVPASLAAVFVLCLALVLQYAVMPQFRVSPEPAPAATVDMATVAATPDEVSQYRNGVRAGQSVQTPAPSAAPGTAGDTAQQTGEERGTASEAAPPATPRVSTAALATNLSRNGETTDGPPPHVGGSGRSALLTPTKPEPAMSLEELLAKVRQEESGPAAWSFATSGNATDTALTGSPETASAEAAPEGRTLTQAPAAKEPEPASPEAWLDSIEQLLVQGRVPEAYRQMQLFNRAYPNYEIAARRPVQ